MDANTDDIHRSIQRLGTFLFQESISKETEPHPLFILRDQLQVLDDTFHLATLDEQHKLVYDLSRLKIEYFIHLLQQYSSTIPFSLVKALLDTIRFQVNMSMNVNPLLTDHYFHFSTIYLTTNSNTNYLEGKTANYLNELFLNFFASIGSRAVHIKTNISYSICVSHTNISNFFELNASTESLLQAIITYLNNFFFHNHQQSECHTSILKWLLNLTNIYGFVPYFVKMEYPNTVLQWMALSNDQGERISLNHWFLILNLLHNLARHRMGVKTLNKLKAIAIIKQWKDQHMSRLLSIGDDENDKDILIAYHLVYAILLEPKELKKEEISNIQTVLDYILERTVQAFKSPDLCFGSYNICEYLNGLTKFVVNDKFLLYIISREKIFDLLMDKFLLFNVNYQSTDLNTIICSSLYTIFWSISFQSEYHSKLKSMEEFIAHVEQISKLESNDEHAIMMKRAAKGILYNLDLIQMDIQPIEESINENQVKIMISYAHKDMTFCQKLLDQLTEQFDGDIWVDFKRLSLPYEDDWEEIAIAITQCDVVLMIVTENYCSSKSCRREVIHADKRNKRMIPIYQGKDYKPDDWFEIRVGSAVRVRFGDKKSDEEVMNNLLKLIHAQEKVRQSNQENDSCRERQIETTVNTEKQTILKSLSSHHLNSMNAPILSHVLPPIPVEQWTSDEIKCWFQLNLLSDVLFNTLNFTDGCQLLTYAQLLIGSSLYTNDEYESLRNRIGKDVFYLDEYARFLSGLTKLIQSLPVKKRSNFCIII
ncbi:unnamed protein product [Adineta ricciae]|uniref:TIR domain-containing protein n=1 Tax=Adineta ricciae TaxID=249248 RepID=A0A813YSZ3_ADIRI|nr:unnamed protein product [Adineta ricciae]